MIQDMYAITCPGAASAWYISSSIPAAMILSAISRSVIASFEPAGRDIVSLHPNLFPAVIGSVEVSRMNSVSNPTKNSTCATSLAYLHSAGFHSYKDCILLRDFGGCRTHCKARCSMYLGQSGEAIWAPGVGSGIAS